MRPFGLPTDRFVLVGSNFFGLPRGRPVRFVTIRTPFVSFASDAPRPFAAVLGCSDARVPIELIFNEGPNDLFVIRGAGNGLGSEVLGSLKYAVEHLGGSLKVVVVLGHSGLHTRFVGSVAILTGSHATTHRIIENAPC